MNAQTGLMRGSVVVATVELVTEECRACHIIFAIPKHLSESAQADRTVHFFCPAGHPQSLPHGPQR